MAQAQVIFDRDERAPGASVVTVFSDADGRFRFPGIYADATSESPITVRALGYEQLDRVVHAEAERGAPETLEITFVVGVAANQAAVAPA